MVGDVLQLPLVLAKPKLELWWGITYGIEGPQVSVEDNRMVVRTSQVVKHCLQGRPAGYGPLLCWADR